jgi:hypothetical protein
MRELRLNRLGVILVSLLAILAAASCQTPTPLGQVEPTLIRELKGPEWERFLDQTVTVEGIFVRDPLPMLVTDLDIVLKNERMPEDQYILLAGDAAERIDPDQYGGHRLRVTGQVNSAGGGNGEGGDEDKEPPKYAVLANIEYTLLEHLVAYSPKIIEMRMLYDPNPDPTRYAILFAGGINAANNHTRYWNDLKFMYSTLVGTLKFSKDNIAVLYADGKAVDNNMPVHYSATQANLDKVFTLLRQHSTDKDLVFFFTTNHGGGFEKDDLSAPIGTGYSGQWDADADEPGDSLNEKKYNLDINNDGDKNDTVSWDEELCAWGGSIYDDAFHTIVANLKFKQMVIVMEQCFSGGLIHDMAQGGDRIIISAAGEYEPSWSLASGGNYNEFSYYFTSAINKADPSGTKVDADTDKSKKVSLVEAFNYARSKDTRSETPWYEDSGDGTPHSGAMPASGEGTLGGKTTLEP